MASVPLNDLGRIPAETMNRIQSEIADVLSSGWFLKGPHTKNFELKLSQRLSGRPTLGVANGTDALYVALVSVGVKAGSRVATVANAGGYTTGVTTRLHATPVLIDVDRASAQMSSGALQRAIEKSKIDVVVLTHLYGLAGEVEEIAAMCLAANIPLVEDCAQSLGVFVNGKPVGTFGAVATTSFYPTKNLGAFGDGGAVICNGEQLLAIASSISQYGWSERYIVDRQGGINSRLDEIQAVVLSHMEQHLDENNERRRSIVERYSQVLRGGRSMLGESSPRFSGHLAIMISNTRDTDRDHLETQGIQTGLHYPISDHQQPAWRKVVEFDELPQTDWLTERILTLPCFPGMTEGEVDQVVRALSQLR